MRFILGTIALLCASGGALAQPKPASDGGIYYCIENGKKKIYDRPTQCEQQEEHSPDGSLKRVLPPPQSDEDRARIDQEKRDQEAKENELRVQAQRDKSLRNRFPNQVAHDRARTEALNAARGNLRIIEARIALLKQERVPLDNEVEFYPDRTKVPLKTQMAIDANTAALEAQRLALVNQRSELDRINQNYDEELRHLQVLWRASPQSARAPSR